MSIADLFFFLTDVVFLFIIGVCNTDNFSLLSITIDYGPFGFMDEYNPGTAPFFFQFKHAKKLCPHEK